MTNKKLAIIGVNGYLGRHMANHFRATGFVVDGYDLQESASILLEKYSKLDICSQESIEQLKLECYSAILFFAGLSGVEASFEHAEDFVRINILGLLNVLARLSKLGSMAPKLIFPSSRLVYQGGDCVSESSLRRSRSVYAASKIACEELLSAYNVRFNIPYMALRICVPYGHIANESYSYGTIGFFSSRVKCGKPIELYGDGLAKKTYTHINDLCAIIEKLVVLDVSSGVYNVGGCDYTLEEVAKLICERLGGRITYVSPPESAQRVEMGNISMDSTKLDKAIDFKHYQKMEDCIGDL